jgi:hypothetical protein
MVNQILFRYNLWYVHSEAVHIVRVTELLKPARLIRSNDQSDLTSNSNDLWQLLPFASAYTLRKRESKKSMVNEQPCHVTWP